MILPIKDIQILSKSELAYDFLRGRIVTARIPPDTPLRIQTLGRDSGLGSTPVREALFRLEAEKLVVSEANCGFKSAPISIEQVKDLEHSRLVIETALLRDAIETGADEWEGKIVAAHYQLAKLRLPVDTEDAAEHQNWAEKHKNFHASLLSAAGSNWLSSFYNQLSEQLDRHYHYTLEGPLRSRFQEDEAIKAQLRSVLGIDHHTALMDATLARDLPQATQLLEEHVGFAYDMFVEVFS